MTWSFVLFNYSSPIIHSIAIRSFPVTFHNFFKLFPLRAALFFLFGFTQICQCKILTWILLYSKNTFFTKCKYVCKGIRFLCHVLEPKPLGVFYLCYSSPIMCSSVLLQLAASRCHFITSALLSVPFSNSSTCTRLFFFLCGFTQIKHADLTFLANASRCVCKRLGGF